jgi:hypothetical protein
MNESCQILEVAPAFYNEMKRASESPNLLSIDLLPWHKGLEVEVSGTFESPDLEDLIGEWYYDIAGDLEPHTRLSVIPSTDAGLVFLTVLTINEEEGSMFDEDDEDEEPESESHTEKFQIVPSNNV